MSSGAPPNATAPPSSVAYPAGYGAANATDNVTDLTRWCVINTTVRPDDWPESPPPMPPGGWRPPYHLSPPPSPPPPPYRAPPPPPPPPHPPDLTLNLTYPPAPAPPVYPLWVPCNDTVAGADDRALLFGAVDANHPGVVAGAILFAIFSLAYVAWRRHERFERLRLSTVPTFEGEVARWRVLKRAKRTFEAMEEKARRDAEDAAGAPAGGYDSDDSEFGHKVMGTRRKRKLTWEEWAIDLATRAMEEAKKRLLAALVKYAGWKVKKKRRKEAEGDGDEAGSGSDSDSEEEEEEYADHSRDEFQQMFGLTGESEWEERLLALMDSDGNGTIDYKEFVVGLGILGTPAEGSPDDAAPAGTFANFCFKLIDVGEEDGEEGYVSREEVLSVIWRYVRFVEAETIERLEALRAKENVRRLGDLRGPTADASEGDPGASTRAAAADVEAGLPPPAPRHADRMMYRPNQDHARAFAARRTALEELTSWAEEEAMRREARLSGRDEADARAFRDAARWRAAVAGVRRRMSDAAATLRARYPARITPREFTRIVTDIPEPFRPADALYRKFKPYLRACAHVVRVVPGLKLEELRAAHSAAVWREEQNPAWAFEAIAKKHKENGDGLEVEAAATGEATRRPSASASRGPSSRGPSTRLGTSSADQRDPELLAELAGMARSRASAAYVPSRARRGNDAKNASALTAAASVGDRSAEMRVGRDGAVRRSRGTLGPRVAGRSGAASRDARARVASLAAMPPEHAVEQLSHVSDRARILAMRMLAPEDAARVARAMAPRPRAETLPELDPRVETLVTEMLKKEPPGREAKAGRSERTARINNVGGFDTLGERDARWMDRTRARAPLEAVDANAVETGGTFFGGAGAESGARFPSDDDAGFAEQDAARARRDVLDEDEAYVYMGGVDGAGDGAWAPREDRFR